MKVARVLVVGALQLLCGCGMDASSEGQLGELSVSLSTQAGGATYRVSGAKIALDGPSHVEVEADDEESLELELAPGAYTLQLQEGYQLVRTDDAQAAQVNARLVSANPQPVLVSAGQTAHVTLRFELLTQTTPSTPGKLSVAVQVSQPDAGPSCDQGLLISELDYDQTGSDDAEFVEIVNSASCDFALAGVSLELLNGTDGKVYGRYDLSKAAPTLRAGGRLVVADEAVLRTLGSAVLGLPLNATGLQNGPDAVRLVRAETTLDVMAYEAAVTGASTTFSVADEAERALSRCTDITDTDDVGRDFKLAAPTPGLPNTCE